MSTTPSAARLLAPLRGLALIVSAASLLALGCAAGDVDAFDPDAALDGGGGSDPSAYDAGAFTPEVGACEGPLGKPQDPATLPGCCPDFKGTAHCIDSAKIPAQLTSILDKCDGPGTMCVPDDFIKTGGVFTPKKCTAFGGDGRCVSQCVPQVKDKAGILLQDVCQEWEKCVPCINPLDHTSTHVCELTGRCKGDDAGPALDSGPALDAGPPECPHKGPPVVDPAKMPACQCPDAHCLSKGLVPAAMAGKLAACSGDPTGLCVPDPFIASGGNFIPDRCVSVNGDEGRCLSACLPDVAAKAAELPQATCAAGQKCVPCWDPISGADSGACTLSCDPGPTTTPKPFPKCCKDQGSCVATSLVPAASASSLTQDKCAAADLCIPDVFLHKTWARIDCAASTWLGSAGPGVCMPECIKGMSFLLLKGACPSGMKCAPCTDPLSGKSTGACEFKL